MKRFLPVAAALIALLLYLPGIWRMPFADVPEPLEALVVWEMVSSGDWVLPRRNGEEIPAKPPLYHWIAAGLSEALGGVNEITVRLPSAVFAAFAVGLVCWAAAGEWGVAAGAASAVVLATSPEWARWAVTARTDATFAALITLALVLGDRWLRTGRTALLLALAAAAGGAVLAKGPAGALLPAIVLAVEIRRRRAGSAIPKRGLLPAAIVFAAIAGSWYTAAFLRGGVAFFQKQILAENVLRFLPSEEGGPSRGHSVLFYLPALAIGMAPWSLILPWSVASVWRKGGRGERAETEFGKHLVTWLIVVLAVCTAASGKRSSYILPLYPAAAMLVGRTVSGLLESEPRGAFRKAFLATGWLLLMVVWSGVLALGLWRASYEPWSFVLPWLHPRDREALPALASALGPPPLAIVLPLQALAISLAVALRRQRWMWVAGLLGVTMLLATLAGMIIVRPVEARLKTFEPFAERVAARVAPNEPLAFFRRPQYAVLFYLRRHVPVEEGRFDGIDRPGWALVWESDWNRLDPRVRARGEVVEVSPPSAPHRKDSHLYLIHLSPGSTAD